MSADEKKRRNRLSCLVIGAISLVLAAAVGLLFVAVASGGETPVFGAAAKRVVSAAVSIVDKPVNSDDARPVAFTVTLGEAADTIGRRLNDQGLINNHLLFRVIVRYYKLGANFQAGNYELRRNMSVRRVIDELQHGRKPNMFVILEGWRSEEIAQEIVARGLFDVGEFNRLLRQDYPQYSFLAGKPAGSSIEGYLFPDSYDLPAKVDAAGFVKMLLDNFESHFTPEMRRQAAAEGLTVQQVLTLASIVEREAVKPEERPIIAGVFFNRLRQQTPLAADPTIQYAVANNSENVARFGYWKKDLTVEDLAIDSPYNTRKYKGLPPGPIGNPGLDSIKAVLQPAQTDYLFFVARPDGSHVFARTFEEHLANVKKYQP